MEILLDNPWRISFWPINKFCAFIITIQMAFLGLIVCNFIDFQILYITQVVAFIYLFMIPGLLIIRLLRLYTIEIPELLLFSVGLSIATIYFVGLLVNSLVIINIPNPLSMIPLALAFGMINSTLLLVSYLYTKDIKEDKKIKITLPDLINGKFNSVYILLLIPFMAVVGTYFVNYHSNNILLLIMIIYICVIIFLNEFYKIIPKKIYPLMVFSISISLLLHNSLITSYIVGFDIHTEYYFYKITEIESFWNNELIDESGLNVHRMLASTILPTVASVLLNIDGTWIFKIIYPFIFSLLPVGLYHLFKKLTEERTALLSALFFVSIYVFYTEMLCLPRQMIAEFFLGSLLLLLVSNLNSIKFKFLAITFLFCLTVSHYGTTYFYIALLILSYVVMVTFNTLYKSISERKSDNYLFKLSFITIFAAFIIIWYVYISPGTIFDSIVYLFDKIIENFSADLLNTRATNIVTRQATLFLNQLIKYVFLLSNIFIYFGLVVAIFKVFLGKNHPSNQSKNYLILSMVTGFLLLIPLFTDFTGMNYRRIYQICLIILSPFCVLGATILLERIIFYLKKRMRINRHITPEFIFSLFLILFFLLNCGFIHEIANQQPKSLALSQQTLMKSDAPNDLLTIFYYRGYNSELDVYGAIWLKETHVKKNIVYADQKYRNQDILRSYGQISNTRMITQYELDNINSYIFLGTINTKHNLIVLSEDTLPFNYEKDLENSNVVYSNEFSKVLFI